MRKKTFTTLLIALLCAMSFISCNKDEDEHLFEFESIEYFIEDKDGVSHYKTPMASTVEVENYSEIETTSPQGNALLNNEERYVFNSDNNVFNPSEEFIYTRIPYYLVGGDIVLSNEKKLYNNKEINDSNFTEVIPSFTVPPMTHLIITGELTIEKISLTYYATFISKPSKESVIVKGKYIRYTPIAIQYKSELKELSHNTTTMN